MPENIEIPKVSMANTKKELLDAYETAKKQLKIREKERLDARKAQKQMEKELAAATAKAEVAGDPFKRLYDLRGDISRELTRLAERYEKELDTYRKVQTAVKTKQEELETIYGIETAASDLAALIEAQQAAKEEFEQKMQARRSAFEEEMRESRSRWNQEKATRQQEAKEEAEAIEKRRKREKEEYEYAFAREKEQRKNALEDQLRAIEIEITQKREAFEQEVSRRTAELEAREEAVLKQEQETAALKQEAETFPQRVEENVRKAVDAATARLTSDFEKTSALLKAQFTGEKNVLSSKIASLESLVAAQRSQIEELSKRNEQAYEKVQDIANRAVAAAKREYIPVPAAMQSAGGSPEK